MKTKIRVYFLLVTAFLVLSVSSTFADQSSILTVEQNKWLSSKNRTILVRPEQNYPPFVFKSSSGINTQIQGLGVDYLELIAKKINTKIQYFEAGSLSNILASLKEGKDGVVIAITETAERDEYLYFTKPFVSVPAVIVLRKDSSLNGKNLTLASLSGKVVAVGASYGVESYIKTNYNKVLIEEVTDDEVGLQKLLLGEVDAAVMDLASLSYYTSNDMLSYVRVASQTGFDYDLSFGISKNTPELKDIFNSALDSMSPQDKTILRDKWITFKDSGGSELEAQGFLTSNNNTFISIIILSLFFLIVVYLLVRSFWKTQLLLIQNMWRRPKNSPRTLSQEFEELEDSKDIIKDELARIEELEKDIKDKIEHKS
jgi:ABC-type amino acid transport substrate-binding protein